MCANVACSVFGCTNLVIGQCTGYKRRCGKYYCATHSANGLCADCTRRKFDEETALKMYEDYLRAAEQVQRELRSEQRSKMLPIILIAGVLDALLCFGASRGDLASASLLIFFVAFLIWVAVWQHTKEKAKVAEIGDTKRAFPDFYNAWKAERNKEQLKQGLAVAGVLAAIVFAAQQQQAYHDVHHIREKLDRL